jgi:hypothetical protein
VADEGRGAASRVGGSGIESKASVGAVATSARIAARVTVTRLVANRDGAKDDTVIEAKGVHQGDVVYDLIYEGPAVRRIVGFGELRDRFRSRSSPRLALPPAG